MNKKLRRKLSTRRKIKNYDRPRLVVSRSNKHIFAQVVDQEGKSLVGVSDRSLKGTRGKNKIELAEMVGAEIGKRAIAKKVTDIVFDRGEYKYHGRVKALAEKAREAGLKF